MALSPLPQRYGRQIAASGSSTIVFLSQKAFACIGVCFSSTAGGRADRMLTKEASTLQPLNNATTADSNEASEAGTSYAIGSQDGWRDAAGSQHQSPLSKPTFLASSPCYGALSYSGHSPVVSRVFLHPHPQYEAPISEYSKLWSASSFSASFSRGVSTMGFGGTSVRMASGGSGKKDDAVEDNRQEIDSINDLFAEARDEIETALESKETTYFNEDAAVAAEAVAQVLERYNALLAKVGEDQRGVIQRAMGLKMEQLKAELAQLDPEH